MWCLNLVWRRRAMHAELLLLPFVRVHVHVHVRVRVRVYWLGDANREVQIAR
jgi:hypothetical protein